jgi:predicted amidophosphoribosyltransferase
MSEIICNHCGRTFEEDNNHCPFCQTPTPAQKDKDLAAVKKKMIIFIVGVSIFCAIMILWLPRNIP